jgi:twitching motility protein PilI
MRAAMTDAPLAALRDDPWALLCEMERRALARAAASESADESREWVGIGFRLGSERFVAPRDEVREIVVCPSALARVPGARPWVAGIASLRGQLLTVIDLKNFLGGGATRPGRDTRVVVLNHRDLPSGLLVDEVYGFRRFADAERSAAPPEGELRCRRYLAGAFGNGDDAWPVFSLQTLAESPSFLHAARDD